MISIQPLNLCDTSGSFVLPGMFICDDIYGVYKFDLLCTVVVDTEIHKHVGVVQRQQD